jgi:hypothetical protein
MRYLILFLFLPFLGLGQSCSICPPGPVTLDGSDFDPSYTFYWSCSNGFTSSLQSPVFSPVGTVTCNLLVTNGACTQEESQIVQVCDCSGNNPCVSMSYNPSTDCVTFNNTGTSTSPVNTDIIQWKNQNTSFATIANGGQICNCSIKEYVNTSANVTINGSNFRLNINGVQNRCHTCAGSILSVYYSFPISGSVTSGVLCAQTSDYIDVSPADFANRGYVCDAYLQYVTPFGTVINHYRYAYNGAGLNTSNVTVTEVMKNTIYKDITAKRTVTYSDGCPSVVCQVVLDIPQQPNDPCDPFFAYVANANLGSPCSAAGYVATVFNGTTPYSYQWSYNGTPLSGQTFYDFCLTGQPDGTYCVQITDAAGCVENVCRVKQTSCTITASITQSGTTLNSTVTGCTGTRTNTWARFDGTTWVTVGTGNSYNTLGVAGDYRLTVSCSGPPVCVAIALYTYTPPCTADVTLTTGSTTLTANVTGCGGTSITYVWDRWNGTSWVAVQTVTTTSTSNVYTPTLSGLYRITITCAGCSDQAQTSWTAPSPCVGFSTAITGTFTDMCIGTSRVFNRTITGGTGPFTQQWKLNGTNVGTGTSYTFNGSTLGTYAISITVTDALGCIFTDTRNISVITCCGMTVGLSTNLSVCQNQNATFTATPSGGTAPITYSWTSQLLPAAPVSQGSGNPKTFNFPTVGSYNIVVTATDNTGCIATDNATMTVTSCTSCVCTPDLTIAGCILTGTFTGAGCGSFTYQLQYSLTGTGWSVVASGSASPGGTFNYTPTANGIYRLAIVATGCGVVVDDLSVNCFNPTCSNNPTLILNGSYQEVCGTSTPVTVTGNIFGGSATNTTLTENGVGSLSSSFFTSSPFSFTYTPGSGDLNNTVTINGTTNNPLGSPCVPATDSYGIFFKPLPTPSITSSSGNICSGSSRALTATPTGGTWTVISGPGSISGSTLTATGIGTIVIRYSVTQSGCTATINQTITSLSCPCQNLSLSVTPTPGSISFGNFLNNGVHVTNYRIQWRKCSDNSVVFESGRGTGLGTGIYPHPSSNIPLPAGCYYPYILTSDVGNNLDCFNDFNIVNWNCGTPPNYSYSGPGGAAATREFQMDINNTVAYIRITLYNVQTVPDLLQIIYNGVVIYSTSSNIGPTPVMIAIPYVSGVNVVTFRVTNSTPSENTIWTIGGISCCTNLVCPIVGDVPDYTGASSTENTETCSCTIIYESEPDPDLSCKPCRINAYNSTTAGGCNHATVNSDNVCVNDVIVVTKAAGANRTFDFSNSTVYNNVKSYIVATTTPDQYIRITLKNVVCSSDGQIISFDFFPLHSTITYDDVNFIISITLNPTNPYPANCTSCNYSKRTKYISMLAGFNSTTIGIGTWNAVNRKERWVINPVNVAPVTFNRSILCNTPCSSISGPNYRLSYRNVNCPCQSWQLHRDDGNNFGTLIDQQAGWTGSCL